MLPFYHIQVILVTRCVDIISEIGVLHRWPLGLQQNWTNPGQINAFQLDIFRL